MTLKRFFPLVLLLIFLVCSSLFGQVNISQTSAESGYPAVAVNQQGVILAVWPEGGDEAGTLYYNVYKDGSWAGAKNVKITKLQGWSPQLDVDSDGIFHLGYADGNSRLNREIYHCTYNPDSGWSNATMVWQSAENSAWQKIDIEGDRIYIIWHHEHQAPYLGYDIIMQTKEIDEKFWPSAYERLSWTADDNSTHPCFKVRNDRIYTCYMEGVGDAMPWRLFFKEANRGSAWNTIPVEEVAGLGYRPELEVDDDGNAHVVWATKVGNYMYRSKVDGTWRGAEVISDRFSKQQFGDLRYNNNVLVATWIQSDALGESAYYAKKNIGGAWGKPVQIDQGSTALFPRVWIDDNGYAHFVWQDQGEVYYTKVAVPPPDPFIQLSSQSLSFTVEGENPDPTSVSVKNIGEKSLNYEVSVDQSWISVTPTSGTLNKDQEQELQCVVDAVDLDEGTHTATITVSSKEALNSPQEVEVTLEVLAPPIYAPLNFTGEVLENKALFYREYMHRLTWQANPDNKKIAHYRLYEIDGVNHIFLEEFPSSTFEYTRRHIRKDKDYTYELWAVDEKGRTGKDPAELAMSSVSTNKQSSKYTKDVSLRK